MIEASLARRLKLVGLDVDGVLTDNGVYLGMVGDHPVEFKRFHIQDGLGVRLLRTAGLLVVWLSGRGPTDERFKFLHGTGQTGLSTPFDRPPPRSIDSDDPRALGQVGRLGGAADERDD